MDNIICNKCKETNSFYDTIKKNHSECLKYIIKENNEEIELYHIWNAIRYYKYSIECIKVLLSSYKGNGSEDCIEHEYLILNIMNHKNFDLVKYYISLNMTDKKQIMTNTIKCGNVEYIKYLLEMNYPYNNFQNIPSLNININKFKKQLIKYKILIFNILGEYLSKDIIKYILVKYIS